MDKVFKLKYLLILTVVSFLFGCGPKEIFSGAHLHHIFPNEFKTYFKANGINNDLYCIPLTQKEHNRVHGPYNKKWAVFVGLKPRASKEELFGFAAVLLADLKISGDYKFYEKKTRKPTGELLDVKTWAKKARKLLGETLSQVEDIYQQARSGRFNTLFRLVREKPVLGFVLAPLVLIAPVFADNLATFLDSWPVVITMFLVETGLLIYFWGLFVAWYAWTTTIGASFLSLSAGTAAVPFVGIIWAVIQAIFSVLLTIWGYILVAFPYLELIDKCRRTWW